MFSTFHFPSSRNSTQKQTLLGSSLFFRYLICLFFDCKHHLHLSLFSLIVMAFPACTCEAARILHSFEFLCQVCRSGSKDICNLQHRFLCFLLFFICILFPFLHYDTRMFFLFPQCVPSELEVGYEKSILTRTETFSITLCFKEPPVIYNFISQENVSLFAIYFHQNIKLGPKKFFVS